jgi:hypothetical protein
MPSKLYIYDATSEADRDQAAGRFDDDDNVHTVGITKGPMEVKETFDKLLADHMQFNRLLIQTHGGPGKIWFGDDFIDASVWKGTFFGNNYEKLFPKPTKIYFDGCDVGAGGRGADFMIAAGYVLLRMQGGIVLAFTNTGYGIAGWAPLFGGHTVHFGRNNLKALRFWADGKPNFPDSIGFGYSH